MTWFTLKKYGITVAGTPIKELDISTSIFGVKSYVRNNVDTYWKNWLAAASDPSSAKRAYALTNEGVEWCVCGIARMYYTLKENDIASKSKAVEYGLTCLPEFTRKILEEAVRIRNGEKNKQYDSRYVRRKDMLDYMGYIISEIDNMPLE